MSRKSFENHVEYLTPPEHYKTVMARFLRIFRKHKLSRRRGRHWYRHKEAWTGRYRDEIRLSRGRDWIEISRNCEELLATLVALTALENDDV